MALYRPGSTCRAGVPGAVLSKIATIRAFGRGSGELVVGVVWVAHRVGV